jgi:hypothetical protein
MAVLLDRTLAQPGNIRSFGRAVPTQGARTALIQLTVDFLTAAFVATLPMTEKPEPQAEDAQS